MTYERSTDAIDWSRLADHLARRASVVEEAEFGRWLAAAPERRQLVDALERVWVRAAEVQEPLAIDVPAAWLELRERLEQPAVRKPSIGRRRGIAFGGPRVDRWLALAAAAAIVVLGIGVVFAAGRFHVAVPRGSLAVREVVTARGQRAELHLADGSRVVLGVDSKLRWPATFGAGVREVALDGEALFGVVHDPARPFVVRSANAVIDDMGTEFGVRAYPGDGSVRVVVRNGSVALAPAHDTVTHRAVLQTGDMGSLGADGGMRIQHGVDVERELAFAEGRLELNDAPMTDVARALDRWYGVQLVVDEPSLARATVNASFGANEELSAVLRTLARTLGARVQQRGRIVQLIVVH